MDIVLELLFEVGFQIVSEILTSSAAQRSRERFPIPTQGHPVLSFFAYLFAGGLLGSFSLAFFPYHFVTNPDLRLALLFVGPVIAGIIMANKAKWLRRRGKEPVRLDSFACGAAFSFIFMLIRFFYAR